MPLQLHLKLMWLYNVYNLILLSQAKHPFLQHLFCYFCFCTYSANRRTLRWDRYSHSYFKTGYNCNLSRQIIFLGLIWSYLKGHELLKPLLQHPKLWVQSENTNCSIHSPKCRGLDKPDLFLNTSLKFAPSHQSKQENTPKKHGTSDTTSYQAAALTQMEKFLQPTGKNHKDKGSGQQEVFFTSGGVLSYSQFLISSGPHNAKLPSAVSNVRYVNSQSARWDLPWDTRWLLKRNKFSYF